MPPGIPKVVSSSADHKMVLVGRSPDETLPTAKGSKQPVGRSLQQLLEPSIVDDGRMAWGVPAKGDSASVSRCRTRWRKGQNSGG